MIAHPTDKIIDLEGRFPEAQPIIIDKCSILQPTEEKILTVISKKVSVTDKIKCLFTSSYRPSKHIYLIIILTPLLSGSFIGKPT